MPAATDLPGGDDPDPVRESLDVGEVVAGEQHGDAVVAQAGDDASRDGPALRVHARGGLVEDRDLRSPHQGEGEPESLAFAARQPPVAGRGHGPQADQVEELVGVARIGMEPGVLAKTLERTRAHVDATRLEHQAHAGAQRPSARGGVGAEHPDRAPVGRAIALDDLDGRGLARAVRPEQGHDLAGLDPERHAVDDGSSAVTLHQAIDLDGAGHGAIRAYWRSKSGSVSSPIWIERMIPSRSTKYVCGRPATR